MEFKYRVKGLVTKPLILRGAYFAIGDNMDFYIQQNELEFVKGRCEVKELVDLVKKPVATPEPVLEQKTETKPKGVKNELQTKSNGNANKGKHKANIQLA